MESAATEECSLQQDGNEDMFDVSQKLIAIRRKLTSGFYVVLTIHVLFGKRLSKVLQLFCLWESQPYWVVV